MFRKAGGGKPPQPNNNNNKKAAVFKAPLRFPAPGASPLHTIKQPGVCFLSPPAAHPPGGRGDSEAQPDTAPVPRGGTSPTGTPWPLVWGFPVSVLWVKQLGLLFNWFFPLSCQAAFPVNCGFCFDSGNPVYTRTEFSRSLLYSLAQVEQTCS